MQNEKEFQSKVQRIGELVHGLDKIEDPESRAGAKALVQLLLDLHSEALERVMQVVAKNDESGQRTIDDLGRDSLVSSLLVLYGLHPLDVETRVAQAVEKVQPRARKGGGELELLVNQDGVVRLRIEVTGHGCGSTGQTLKAMVEDALYEAAPDMNSLLIEGIDEPAGSSGFVPLGKLGGVIATVSAEVVSQR
ncbi:MAG TPA: NifU family protein [Terriglobales bacterium]|nr:NifU family protein [Terriglobales bacterium]